MIQDKHDQALFSIFHDKINSKILQKLGVGHAAAGTGATEIFNDNRVNESFISPTGLVKALTREFYADDKIIRNPWEIIRTDLGDDLTTKLADNKTSNENAANLAAYLTIQHTIPDLLESKYLQKFKTECEGVIEGVRKQQAVTDIATTLVESTLEEGMKNVQKPSKMVTKLRKTVEDQKEEPSQTVTRLRAATSSTRMNNNNKTPDW